MNATFEIALLDNYFFQIVVDWRRIGCIWWSISLLRYSTNYKSNHEFKFQLFNRFSTQQFSFKSLENWLNVIEPVICWLQNFYTKKKKEENNKNDCILTLSQTVNQQQIAATPYILRHSSRTIFIFKRFNHALAKWCACRMQLQI